MSAVVSASSTLDFDFYESFAKPITTNDTKIKIMPQTYIIETCTSGSGQTTKSSKNTIGKVIAVNQMVDEIGPSSVVAFAQENSAQNELSKAYPN